MHVFIGCALAWCVQDYLHFIQGPKPGSEAFQALFPNAVEGQEEATRMGVVRCAWVGDVRCAWVTKGAHGCR